MQKAFVFILASLTAITISAQPTNKVYWVGPNIGSNLNSTNWASTSGGAAGSYPNNVDYQLIFDGGVTAGQTYILDINTATGGFIRITNNTTVVLQDNSFAAPPLTFMVSGLSIDPGSKLVFQNGGSGLLGMGFSSTYYASDIAGELHLKSTHFTCTNPLGCGPQVWLILTGLFTPSGTKVLTVSGTLQLDGSGAMINGIASQLVFGPNSTFIINSDQSSYVPSSFPATATIVFAGGTVWPGGASYPNFIYDNTSQTTNISFVKPVSGNMLVKNTGTGNLVMPGSVIGGNLTLQGSPKVQIGGSTVNGNVDIQSGQFDVTSNVTVKGSLTNQGIMKSSGTGVIKFAGTVQQVIQTGIINNDPVSFEVSNPAGILLNNNWTLPSDVNAKLLLTNGNISMGINTLTIQNPSPDAIVGGTAASHIIGKLRRATNTAGAAYLFPVSASATESANVKLSPVSSAPTTYEVSFSRPNPYDRLAVPAGIRNAANYVWDISRVSGAANADVTFVYGANNFASQNGNPQSDLRVLHWNGSSWENLGGVGADGEISVSNVSTFSPFTLGTVGAYALPVQLVSFVGLRQGNSNTLRWTVAQEKDVRDYDVERSADGRTFTSLNKVVAAGNTTSPKDYSYTDNQPLSSINFYRLKIVDKDGKFRYSQTVSMRMSNKNRLDVYPNPALDFISVQYTSNGHDLFVYDVSGKVIKRVRVGQTGLLSTVLDVRNLIKGMYILRVGSETATFVKQ